MRSWGPGTIQNPARLKSSTDLAGPFGEGRWMHKNPNGQLMPASSDTLPDKTLNRNKKEEIMKWIRTGCTREVFLTRNYAIKVPSLHSWRNFLNGLLANMQEVVFSKSGWPELCPVVFSLPGGWCTVMRRAEEMDRETWFAFSEADGGSPAEPVSPWINTAGDYFIPVEMKMNSFGLLDGAIVAIDYGN